MFSRAREWLGKLLSLPDSKADRVFALLFASFHIFQIASVLCSPHDLAADEAHYWDWSRRLDIAYYSKGPLIALLIAGATAVFGDTEFAVRFPALVCSVIFSLGLYGFARYCWGAATALAAWLLVRSALYFSVLGLVMTTDPPLLAGWLGAVAFVYLGLEREQRWYWAAAGACMAVAILSKYTALILPLSVLLFLFADPRLRGRILSLPVVGCMAIAAASLLPVLVWNRSHGWVNFAHNAGHLVSEKGLLLKPRYTLELLGGQAGLIGPLVLLAAIIGLAGGWRLGRRGDRLAGLLFWSSAPLAAACITVSLTKRVYANWPAPIFVGALLLVAHLLHRDRGRRLLSISSAGIILNLFICAGAFLPIFGFTLGVPAKYLTTKKLAGWHELGSRVQSALDEADSRPFVLAADYEHASAIAFYAESHPRVFLANLGDRRMNQYDIWGGLETQKGRDALIVLERQADAELLRPYFADIRVQGEPLKIRFAGEMLREFSIFLGLSYNGRPFPEPERR